MGDDPKEQSGNPLGAIVDPLTKLGIDTARDIAAAVQSTRAAAGDLWKVVNILSRLPGRETRPEVVDDTEDIDDNDENAALPTTVLPVVAPDPAPAENPGIFGGLKRAAVAVTPVRRVMGGPGDFAKKKSDHGDGDKKAAKHDSDADLRRHGDELIVQSQKPTRKQAQRHPAFEQILSELAPDEVRMLRFLAVAGVQPSIDIRTKTMFQVGSERLVSGVNMIADMAGCRWPEADQRYLANLNRLGLVRFSSEPVADYRRYALLEVQPRALEVTEVTPKTISVYRSIYLSEFGEQFCEVCIATDGYNAGGWATDERGDKIIGKGPPDAAAHNHQH